MHPFRFALQVSGAPSAAAWRDLAKKTEDLGYSTLYVPDHFDDQWAPMIALAVAAEVTTALRVGPLVLDNDFRHPVVLAKEAATLDLASEGRLELGLGAGWMRTDYQTSGMTMDRPGIRIDRLRESIEIMKSLWTTGRSTFGGDHYTTNGAIGSPRPHTPGGPPLVIGGGGKRILTLAAQQADIISVIPSLASGQIDAEVAVSAVEELYVERLGWIKEAAGDRFSDIELQSWTATVQIVPNAAEVRALFAPVIGLTPEQMEASPTALVGTTDEITETLRARRDRFGFSYIVVHEPEMEAFAPVVAELAGT